MALICMHCCWVELTQGRELIYTIRGTALGRIIGSLLASAGWLHQICVARTQVSARLAHLEPGHKLRELGCNALAASSAVGELRGVPARLCQQTIGSAAATAQGGASWLVKALLGHYQCPFSGHHALRAAVSASRASKQTPFNTFIHSLLIGSALAHWVRLRLSVCCHETSHQAILQVPLYDHSQM